MNRRAIAVGLLGLPLLFAACSTKNDDDDTGPKYLILGNAMSSRVQNVYIQLGTTAKPGLTVTVNGTTLSNSSGGQYTGTLPFTLAVGDAVALVVNDGIVAANGNAVVPSTPSVTSATVASHGAPVIVNWSAPTSPDSFTISLNFHMPDNSAVAVIQTVAGSVRQVTLSQAEIPATGNVFSIGLQSTNTGTFTGAAAAGSSMGLRALAPSYPFTVP